MRVVIPIWGSVSQSQLNNREPGTRTSCRTSLSRSAHLAVQAKKEPVNRGRGFRGRITDGVPPCATRLSAVEFKLTTMDAVFG
jgi:hypothetical protein